jgi:hypothetical protein
VASTFGALLLVLAVFNMVNPPWRAGGRLGRVNKARRFGVTELLEARLPNRSGTGLIRGAVEEISEVSEPA